MMGVKPKKFMLRCAKFGVGFRRFRVYSAPKSGLPHWLILTLGQRVDALLTLRISGHIEF
jgi:hypothetical protein